MTFDYRNLVEKELARSAGMAAVIETYVQAGAEFANAAAPYRSHPGKHYRDTIHADVLTDTRGVVGLVISDDPFSHLVEFGSVNNPAYAPLRNGVERTGLRVTDRRGG